MKILSMSEPDGIPRRLRRHSTRVQRSQVNVYNAVHSLRVALERAQRLGDDQPVLAALAAGWRIPLETLAAAVESITFGE
jgi:hypothetical protein